MYNYFFFSLYFLFRTKYAATAPTPKIVIAAGAREEPSLLILIFYKEVKLLADINGAFCPLRR